MEVDRSELEAARRAFARAPKDHAVSLTCGALALAAGDAAAAVAPLALAAKHIDDHKGVAAALWSSALAAVGDFEGAAHAAALAAERQPGDAHTLGVAVAALRRIGDARAALGFAEKIATLTKDAAAWADVGAGHARLDQHDAALHAFQKAEAIDPQFFSRATYEAQLFAASRAARKSP